MSNLSNENTLPIAHGFNFFKKYYSLFKSNLNIAELKSKLDLDPDSTKLMLIYGEAHHGQGLYAEACNIFTKAWELSLNKKSSSHKSYVQAAILLAHSESLLMLEKYEDAIPLLKQAEQLNHYLLHHHILCCHGFVLQFQGKEKEAIGKFEDAFKPTLDPRNVDYKSNQASVLKAYGLLLCLQNKPQKAIEKLQAFLSLKMTDMEKSPLYLYGEALRMQGKDKEALEKFEAALTPAQFAEIKQEMENAAKI